MLNLTTRLEGILEWNRGSLGEELDRVKKHELTTKDYHKGWPAAYTYIGEIILVSALGASSAARSQRPVRSLLVRRGRSCLAAPGAPIVVLHVTPSVALP